MAELLFALAMFDFHSLLSECQWYVYPVSMAVSMHVHACAMQVSMHVYKESVTDTWPPELHSMVQWQDIDTMHVLLSLFCPNHPMLCLPLGTP